MPTLLVVTPHPDDEAYAFGGAIALLAGRNWRCVVHCVSSGERGKRHDDGPLGLLAAAREGELAESCRLLGALPPIFWRLPDGGLPAARSSGLEHTRHALQSTRPDLVLALGPDGAYGHPDHLAVHGWLQEAWPEVRAPATGLLFAAFPRGLFLPQYEKCIGMMGRPPHPPAAAIGSDTLPLALDIRQAGARKLAAIAAHRTQLPGGDPLALFPPPIVEALLDTEYFAPADPASDDAARALLAPLTLVAR